MMQNNLMGGGMAQPATAPANPTGLNFQSDPSMRAQFKGFMSGMQAKQPAPMAPSPMQAPLPMPAAMQNVDIFQPQPMQMQMGGAVPRQAMMGGMPHMLSYITPGEAAALSAMGGTGQPGPGGVPSFVYDEAGMGGFSSGVGRDSGPSMGDASFDYSGGGDNNFNVFEDSRDSFTVGPVVDTSLSADRAATQDALSTLLAADALQQDRDKQEALARDITKRSGVPEITEGFGPMSQVVGTTQTPFANNNVKSIRDSVDTIFDIDTTAPDLLSLDAFGPNAPNLDFSDPTLAPTNARTVDIASPLSRPSTLVDYSDPTQASKFVDITGPASRPNYVAPNIPTMTPDERREMELDELGISGNTIGGVDQVGVTVGAPSVGPQPGNLGALGEGSFPSAPNVPTSDGIVRTEAGRTNRIADSGFGPGEVTLAAGSRQPEDRQGFFTTLLDTMTGREFPTDLQKEQNIDKALNAQTTVLLGAEGGNTRSALEQLAERATPSDRGGILGAFTNFGASNAAKMYNDIVNNGYEPVYDNKGQIVATKVPGTNILGSGSVEGRIPGANTGGGGGGSSRPAPAPQPSVADLVAAEMAKLQPAAPAPTQTAPTPIIPAAVNAGPRAPATGGSSLGFGYGQLRRIPGISSNLNTAADDFLNLLGGSNVQNFARGGNVSNDLDAFGGAGPDVGFEGSGRGTFSGGSYSENPFDSGGDDDNVAPTVAPGSFITNQSPQDDGYNINTTQANQMNQQAKADAEARAALEAANLQQQQMQQQQQMAPQKQSIRDRISSVASSSKPSFSDMLGDLFSFNTPDTMSDLERTQLDVRGRMADRGSSYYGQNLPQMTQNLAQLGMTPANTQYMDVLSSGVPGGSRYGGGMQNIGVQYQSPQQVAAGVQAGVQGAFDSLGQQFGGSGTRPFQ